MADVDEKIGAQTRGGEAGEPRTELVGAEAEGGVVESLGVFKYVFAAFFAGAIGLAFLVGKLLAAGWSYMVEWPWAVRTFPWLLRYAEDERPTYTTAVGAVVGVLALIYCLRNDGIRRWADD